MTPASLKPRAGPAPSTGCSAPKASGAGDSGCGTAAGSQPLGWSWLTGASLFLSAKWEPGCLHREQQEKAKVKRHQPHPEVGQVRMRNTAVSSQVSLDADLSPCGETIVPSSSLQPMYLLLLGPGHFTPAQGHLPASGPHEDLPGLRLTDPGPHSAPT